MSERILWEFRWKSYWSSEKLNGFRILSKLIRNSFVSTWKVETYKIRYSISLGISSFKNRNFCQRSRQHWTSDFFKKSFFLHTKTIVPLEKSIYCNCFLEQKFMLRIQRIFKKDMLLLFGHFNIFGGMDCQRSRWQRNSLRKTVFSEFFYFIQIQQTFWQNYLLQLFLEAKIRAHNW